MKKLKVCSLAASLGVAFALTYLPPAHAGSHEPPSPAASALPAQELTPEIVFMLILAEIAGARGELGVSVEAYLKLADQTRDPRIARRATEIALYAHNIAAATRAARLWADTDPESGEARQVLAGVLANSAEQLDEVQLHLARVLAESPEQLQQNMLGLNRALARIPDKQVVRSIVDRLTEPYLDFEPSAHFARAQAAISVDDNVAASSSVDAALKLQPDWEPAVLFKAQLLTQSEAAGQASVLLAGYLQRHPDNRNVRQAYARTLVSARDFVGARREFQTLLNATPKDIDLVYAVALVSAQIDDFDTAIRLFEQALQAGHAEADTIRLQLGHIAEKRGQYDVALRWYHAVTHGQFYIEAQLRVATTLSRSGKLEEARAHLHAIEAEGDDRRRVLLAETMLLRDAGRIEDAYTLVDDALREAPDDEQLLYESAMLAERLDRMNVMEARLRKLIALEPEHSHAYNALGYSLADRGLRLDEAEQLIVRALEITPDDPYILDSLGWVRFRRSDLEGALNHLKRAYGMRPDPEIAAHLGEVMWALNQRAEADALWAEALRAHPDNLTLTRTVKRLRGQ
ncbi:MAG: tetratricopeptide repeat protein [Rhodocyclales bacterium]|nr:tetratricopeptide repeat protein [Rhodocyclales bacterium]